VTGTPSHGPSTRSVHVGERRDPEGAVHTPLYTTADLTFDGTGLLCVTLLLRLRAFIDGARPGTIVHVATDPAAPLDLPAWCHTTGHDYLGRLPCDEGVHALRLAAAARRTHADKPWQIEEDSRSR
jgi:hypothetical protein